nr:retrotransposon Gag protein [Tanacetum cinerariifolium]
MFKFPPYQFAYPEKKLTMDEMLAKLIIEGKREHEGMGISIKEFRTTNELLLKEQNNLLSELKIKVNELSRVLNEGWFSKHQVKGVTTSGGKVTSKVTYDNEMHKGDDEVVFDMEQSMKKPSTKDDECYSLDSIRRIDVSNTAYSAGQEIKGAKN